MATLEDEIRDLKEKNNELVQKVQFWKVAAASKENEKLELMKEINELRLKLSRIRSGGAAQARKLETALQTASEEALTHLVNASSAVARTMELAKSYMQDRQDLDNASPRWSAIGATPNSERVHRVPPMLIGGQSIQPVVSLSRTPLNASSHSHSRTIAVSRSPNQNRSVTERAVPVHLLQDVYIPLTRIDVTDIPGNSMETETESNDLDNSAEDLGLEDSGERSVEDSRNISDDFETSRRLEAVAEDLEPEDVDETPSRNRIDNPLEGPSWLLDRPSSSRSRTRSVKKKNNLEPDSTTRDEAAPPPRPADDEPSLIAAAFSPTLRRRKRTSTPPRASRPRASASPTASDNYSPRPATARRNSNSGRVLKVLVAKMRLDSDSDDDNDAAPPKRPARGCARPARDVSPAQRLLGFDAPSPNGATDARVIVLEQMLNMQSERGSGEPAATGRRDSRLRARDAGDGHGRDTVTFGDSPDHSKDAQNRLADHNDRRSGASGRLAREDEVMVVTYKGGKLGASTVDTEANFSHTGPKTGEGRRDEEGMEVSNRDESRVGSVGDSMELTGRMGSVGPDGRDSDSSTDQAREGRTRRPRKQVVYKEKPLNRKMRR
ncbi:uncharacterized protein LOC128683815 [Plodia interpunctella]|uniref:uncharacterized protein LOC128683815 n=1 Tax=Plodia interpunctella TaxID=58824 RepID=UPI002367DD5E|nr:uncharacterized protein LOC128683815 [Plodia interpunctella]